MPAGGAAGSGEPAGGAGAPDAQGQAGQPGQGPSGQAPGGQAPGGQAPGGQAPGGAQGTGQGSGQGSGPGAGPGDADIDWGNGGWGGTAQDGGGRAAELDRELERALGDFDGEILAEQEALARAGGGPAADAGSRTADSSDAAGSGEGAGSGPRVISRNIFDDDDDGADGAVASRGMVGRGPMHPGLSEEEIAERTPEDVGDGRDDDIVARQLREAAINESDPELREKLWEEYRDYRASIGR